MTDRGMLVDPSMQDQLIDLGIKVQKIREVLEDMPLEDEVRGRFRVVESRLRELARSAGSAVRETPGASAGQRT